MASRVFKELYSLTNFGIMLSGRFDISGSVSSSVVTNVHGSGFTVALNPAAGITGSYIVKFTDPYFDVLSVDPGINVTEPGLGQHQSIWVSGSPVYPTPTQFTLQTYVSNSAAAVTSPATVQFQVVLKNSAAP